MDTLYSGAFNLLKWQRSTDIHALFTGKVNVQLENQLIYFGYISFHP